MQRLPGKVAIITGGSRGQGEATARLFAEHGATVIIADVLDEAGAALAADIGPAAHFRHLDVSDETSWAELVEWATAQFGKIDILINNAAISLMKRFNRNSKADFERVLSVNLVGPFLGMRAVSPQMVERKAGSIVNISSVNGLRGTWGMAAYDASKWGVRGMSKAAALEFGVHGVRVNSIHPGAIDTPMLNPEGTTDGSKLASSFNLPMGRVGEPVEVANASLFLASDEASYISGAELAVDGAWTAGVMSNIDKLS